MTSLLIRVERVMAELLDTYGVYAPPVPIEAILQRPRPGMWEIVDFSELSGTFFAMKDPHGPRLALARLLVRLLVSTPWGMERGLGELEGRPTAVYAAARALLMPRPMLMALPAASLVPGTISILYEVPETEVERRLVEIEAMTTPE
jgi:hypothetical protein